MNYGHQHENADYSLKAHDGSNVNANHFTEHSKLLPWLMLTAILSGFAVAVSLLTFVYLRDQQQADTRHLEAQFARVQRTYDLTDLQVRDQNAILIREGLKQPTDVIHGPAGNYQYVPRKKP